MKLNVPLIPNGIPSENAWIQPFLEGMDYIITDDGSSTSIPGVWYAVITESRFDGEVV
jgi:thioredoxin reductase